jgi:hypothetical protein
LLNVVAHKKSRNWLKWHTPAADYHMSGSFSHKNLVFSTSSVCFPLEGTGSTDALINSLSMAGWKLRGIVTNYRPIGDLPGREAGVFLPAEKNEKYFTRFIHTRRGFQH